MKKILLIIVPLILIVAAAVGVGVYRAQAEVQKFPSHSIKIIREAVQNHDAATFDRFVDADAILETAATEILTAKINSELNSMTYSTLEMQNLYDTLKPEFIAAAQTALKNYVKTGSADFPADLNDAQRWLKDSRSDSCVINGYSKIITGDGRARTKIDFYNTALMFSFEIEVELEQIGETSWRVISAKGFDKYFTYVNRALKARLDTLNAPIQAEIDDVFDVKGFDAAVVEGDEYGFSKTLQLKVKAEIFTDKQPVQIGGNVIIDGRDDQQGVTPFTIDILDEQEDGVQNFTINKVLNPFVRTDADVMRHGLKKRDIHINITEIIFSDGTSIKKLDELPD